jgi:large conductance mechanosensitive channel
MGLIGEFKDFIVKGNAIDLAVGIVIGTLFGNVVTSLVKDVIMPPIGWLMAGVDFSKYQITLPKLPWHAADATPVALTYGNFINVIITLLIQGFAIFMIVRAINKMRAKPAPAPAVPPPPTKEEVLLTEIRDALRSR